MYKYKLKDMEEVFEYMSLVDKVVDELEPIKNIKHAITLGHLTVNDDETGECLERHEVTAMADGVYVDDQKVADREKVLKVLHE